MFSLHRALRRGSVIAIVVLIGLLVSTGFSQAPAKAGLTFDVAAVKPAAPINPAEILQTGKMPKFGMTVEGTRVDFAFVSMADLLRIAYDVKPFQIVGPDWMNNERFDILARMPEGATKEQVPQMLQALLADRFQVKVHRENREHGVYALVVAKGGPKLKESTPEPETPAPAEDQPPQPNTLGPNGGTLNLGNGTQMRIENRSAATGMAATIRTRDNGTMRMNMSPDGQMQMEFSKMTMAQFADTLTPLMDKPVVDMTELKGTYQAALALSMADLLAVAAKSGTLPAGGLPAGNPFGARGAAPGQTPQASDPSSNAIFTSIQQLGLRLDSRKAPVEFIVVDHVEKTPTEN
jgi:uncharacterized protein (TIGR03435 family)